MTQPIPAKLVPVEQRTRLRELRKDVEFKTLNFINAGLWDHADSWRLLYASLCDLLAEYDRLLSSTPQREQDGGWEAGFNAGVEAAVECCKYTDTLGIQHWRFGGSVLGEAIRSLHRSTPAEKPEAEVIAGLAFALSAHTISNGHAENAAVAAISYLISAGWRRK